MQGCLPLLGLNEPDANSLTTSTETEHKTLKGRQTTSVRPENKPSRGGPVTMSTIHQLKKEQEQRGSQEQNEDVPMETTEPDTPDESLQQTCSEKGNVIEFSYLLASCLLCCQSLVTIHKCNERRDMKLSVYLYLLVCLFSCNTALAWREMCITLSSAMMNSVLFLRPS